MSEALEFVLETSNKGDIKQLFEMETICENITEDNLSLDCIRMSTSGAFGVFLSKEDGEFTDKELLVIKRYLNNIGRSIDITGKERIGVVFDKDVDIKPFNNVDFFFPFNKTYKSQSYARMVGLSMMGEVKELNNARPSREEFNLKYI
jgi:hypothetical protein